MAFPFEYQNASFSKIAGPVVKAVFNVYRPPRPPILNKRKFQFEQGAAVSNSIGAEEF